jgi:hypothetical protein
MVVVILHAILATFTTSGFDDYNATTTNYMKQSHTISSLLLKGNEFIGIQSDRYFLEEHVDDLRVDDLVRRFSIHKE